MSIESTLAFVSTYKAVLLVLGEMTGAFYFDELSSYTPSQCLAFLGGSSIIMVGMLLMTIVDQWERRNFRCEFAERSPIFHFLQGIDCDSSSFTRFSSSTQLTGAHI